jgi:DNA-binding transcriptional regulator YdaS (Cro superfamily)
MTPQQPIDFFGSRTKLAVALGVTETAVGQWVRQGWIPYDRQCHIQVESKRLPAKDRAGKEPLFASWDDIPEDKRKVAA